MEDAISKISSQGAKIVRNVPLITLAEITDGSGVKEIEELMSKRPLTQYLARLNGMAQNIKRGRAWKLPSPYSKDIQSKLSKISSGSMKLTLRSSYLLV